MGRDGAGTIFWKQDESGSAGTAGTAGTPEKKEPAKRLLQRLTGSTDSGFQPVASPQSRMSEAYR
jgi:hypothetical protein